MPSQSPARREAGPLPAAIAGVGPKLRGARLRRHLSQREVAAASGLSDSFIRLLEAGRSDISLSRLLGLARLLDLSITDLLGDSENARITVVKPDDRVELPQREPGLRTWLLSPRGTSLIEPAIEELDPGFVMLRPQFHRGQEFLFVVCGALRLIVGDSSADLAAGDAAYYQATTPHRLVNVSDTERAVVLVTDAG